MEGERGVVWCVCVPNSIQEHTPSDPTSSHQGPVKVSQHLKRKPIVTGAAQEGANGKKLSLSGANSDSHICRQGRRIAIARRPPLSLSGSEALKTGPP